MSRAHRSGVPAHAHFAHQGQGDIIDEFVRGQERRQTPQFLVQASDVERFDRRHQRLGMGTGDRRSGRRAAAGQFLQFRVPDSAATCPMAYPLRDKRMRNRKKPLYVGFVVQTAARGPVRVHTRGSAVPRHAACRR
jgi:hypothetical protein